MTLAVPYPATREFRRGDPVRLLAGEYVGGWPPYAAVTLGADTLGVVDGWRYKEWQGRTPASLIVYVRVAG